MRGVTYARPGCGESTRSPGRTVADVAADVAELADRFGADRFYTMGSSGGAPHVLACAALLPDRVLAAAAIAGPAPVGADGLDWLAGTGDLNIEGFHAWQDGPEQHRASLQKVADGMGELTVDDLLQTLDTVLSDVDRAVLVREFAEFMTRSFRRAMLHGLDGWYDDDRAELGDWGFDLGSIRAPVALWHGGQHHFVLARAGELLDELRVMAAA